ncbi:tail protein [Rubrivivax pictus]|uniref:Tail protein n=2 Tax=Pseudaquabacterium pictum TaxID=2315236 RepID=A0A480ASB9_9BURK|nr:tail protein [Rubrivivax pictus]
MLDDYLYLVAPSGAYLVWRDAYLIWETSMLQQLRQQYGLVQHTQDEYRDALAGLLPTGAAWPRDPASALLQLVRSFAAELERLDMRAAQLLAETDPATTTELLPDWERVVGLPDPCVTTGQTVAERRQALEGRLTSVGGQSRRFFIELAARLGYSITIDEFASAAAATAAGISFTGDGWAHTWRVNIPTTVAVTPFRVGAGAVGEPLRVWSNEVIECQFNRYKPAHTRVLFAYAA